MMRATPVQPVGRHPEQAGYVLDVLLRVVLLLLVFGQLVFLGSRYRERADVTKDGLYTLTESTVRVLNSLDRRMVIEAYFSEDETLGPYREYRRMLNNFLDELVQVSGGKIAVDRLNPQNDIDVLNQAERLGIRSTPLQDVGDASLSVNQVWNGLRILYGGDRQDVVPFLQLSPYPMGYEIQLTPRIKALTVPEKPVLGLIAYGTQPVVAAYGGGQGTPSIGYNQLRNDVGDRYELRNIDITQGQLVPDVVDTLFLVRPKNLTDRERYALDQFLMRGGSLVVFVDTDEVEIGQQRLFKRRETRYDAPGHEANGFLEQLAHYGAEVQEKVVADFTSLLGGRFPEAKPTAEFRVQGRTLLGQSLVPLDVYPYWFHAAPIDYAAFATDIAKMEEGLNPNVNIDDLATRYAEIFEPGIDTSNALIRAMKRGPSMFWPCPVELAAELPPGVDGKVLLRSSPLSYAETPPDSYNPFGRSREMQKAAYLAFRTRKLQQLQSEPRQQFGLMVHLKGTFGSFFEGKEIPGRFEEEDSGLVPDPLAEPIVESPVEEGAESEGEVEAEAEDVTAPSTPQDKESDPDALWKASPDAQLIVIGDADFIRDDLRGIQGPYGPQSLRYGPLGPTSIYGAAFFTNMVDWLAEDEDLLALRNISPTNRSLNFASEDIESDNEQYLADIKARERRLSLMVVAGPVAAIVVVWLIATVVRRSRKQAFLATVQR